MNRRDVIPPGQHPAAVIGMPPEHRDWRVGDSYYLPLIAGSARVNAFVTVDGGLTRPTRVGERSFLMAHVHVGHDAVIGDDCELAPGAVICGQAELGDRVRVGVNACVKPFVKVGAGARIGMGAVVTKDVPAGETWVGNPARRLGEKSATEAEGWEAFLPEELRA